MKRIKNSRLVSTLNKMGFMTLDLDPYGQKFIELAKHAQNPLLEVGAAFGTVALEVLQQGATLVANDLDINHLDILEKNTPDALKKNLKLAPGRFPDEISLLENSFEGIFTSRVIHFFAPEMIEKSMEKFSALLIPGGKLFIVTETPYLSDYKNFIPIFEKRKKDGDRWPGMIENVSQYSPTRKDNIPNLLHFFDDETLSELIQRYDFEVEEVSMFERPDYPDDLRLDGRESVGIIARKL
jgi:hypothetical protein